MQWWIWVIIVIIVIIIIKIMITRKKNSSDNFMDKAGSRIKNLGDCCRKFLKFGGT